MRSDIINEFCGRDNIRDSEWFFIEIIYESLNLKEYVSCSKAISRFIRMK